VTRRKRAQVRAGSRRRLRVLTDEEVLEARDQAAATAHAAAQIAYHGPGLTFGELAIGERFEWPAPIPCGPEPMVKTAVDRYGWSRGFGTAETFYRVERVP
jgi:hypothetical protein